MLDDQRTGRRPTDTARSELTWTNRKLNACHGVCSSERSTGRLNAPRPTRSCVRTAALGKTLLRLLDYHRRVGGKTSEAPGCFNSHERWRRVILVVSLGHLRATAVLRVNVAVANMVVERYPRRSRARMRLGELLGPRSSASRRSQPRVPFQQSREGGDFKPPLSALDGALRTRYGGLWCRHKEQQQRRPARQRKRVARGRRLTWVLR